MPDHIHVFVRLSDRITLGRWVEGLKRHLDASLKSQGHTPATLHRSRLSSFWQPGVFDHLLRNEESYEAKWLYVRANPVRAKLAVRAEDGPFHGELTPIDRV